MLSTHNRGWHFSYDTQAAFWGAELKYLPNVVDTIKTHVDSFEKRRKNSNQEDLKKSS